MNNKNNNLKVKKDNIYLLAGEHPREMISPEFMLHFITYLCENQNSLAKKILEKNNFRIIVNANPNGRLMVENGEYCRRTNENEIDLNRNWDYYFGKNINQSEENSGRKAFSEIESVFVRDTIKNFNAKLFLSIHSGTLALFHPYAYMHEGYQNTLNQKKMKEILGLLKSKYCKNCDMGAPSVLIGYQSSGTCLDYIYDNYKVPYSLAWEIYTNERDFIELKEHIDNKNLAEKSKI
jgi:hypothetical protein